MFDITVGSTPKEGPGAAPDETWTVQWLVRTITRNMNKVIGQNSLLLIKSALISLRFDLRSETHRLPLYKVYVVVDQSVVSLKLKLWWAYWLESSGTVLASRLMFRFRDRLCYHIKFLRCRTAMAVSVLPTSPTPTTPS